MRHTGRPPISWRTIAVSGAAALVLAIGVLGYWLDMIPLSRPGPGIPEPVFAARSNSDGARAAADEAAKNKAAEQESSNKAAEAKRLAEDAAAKKAEQDANRQAEADAAKKAEVEARHQAEVEAASKKAEEEAAGRRAAADCDRLAASQFDMTRPTGVAGVDFDKIDAPAATAACNDAMRRYPETVRFVFQAGRAAHGQRDFARAMDLYRAAEAKGSALATTNPAVCMTVAKASRKIWRRLANCMRKRRLLAKRSR